MDTTRHVIRRMLTEAAVAATVQTEYWILPSGETLIVADYGWNHEAAAMAYDAGISWDRLSDDERETMDDTFDGPWEDRHAEIAQQYAEQPDVVWNYIPNPEDEAIRNGWIRVTRSGDFQAFTFNDDALRRIQQFLLDRRATTGDIVVDAGEGYWETDTETVLTANRAEQVKRDSRQRR